MTQESASNTQFALAYVGYAKGLIATVGDCKQASDSRLTAADSLIALVGSSASNWSTGRDVAREGYKAIDKQCGPGLDGIPWEIKRREMLAVAHDKGYRPAQPSGDATGDVRIEAPPARVAPRMPHQLRGLRS